MGRLAQPEQFQLSVIRVSFLLTQDKYILKSILFLLLKISSKLLKYMFKVTSNNIRTMCRDDILVIVLLCTLPLGLVTIITTIAVILIIRGGLQLISFICPEIIRLLMISGKIELSLIRSNSVNMRSKIWRHSRSSHPEMFLRKGVLKICR